MALPDTVARACRWIAAGHSGAHGAPACCQHPVPDSLIPCSWRQWAASWDAAAFAVLDTFPQFDPASSIIALQYRFKNDFPFHRIGAIQAYGSGNKAILFLMKVIRVCDAPPSFAFRCALRQAAAVAMPA